MLSSALPWGHTFEASSRWSLLLFAPQHLQRRRKHVGQGNDSDLLNDVLVHVHVLLLQSANEVMVLAQRDGGDLSSAAVTSRWTHRMNFGRNRC
jgi:hypothetical protein